MRECHNKTYNMKLVDTIAHNALKVECSMYLSDEVSEDVKDFQRDKCITKDQGKRC
jgi:c-di-GMP-related signal transduction protein